MEIDTRTELVRQFYDVYHQHRVRVANDWMRRVYWPALRGWTLEVGAGTLLPQRSRLVMADLSAEAARRAAAESIPATVADGTRLPFAVGEFDTVACYDVLEHVADPHAFLTEMCRVARQRVVVAGPNFVGHHEGGLNRYLPLRLWTYWFAPDQGCPVREDPHLSFDDDWWPDRDALCAPNAGWVAGQLSRAGCRIRHLRSWEYKYHWLNAVPGLRSLGSFMFVVGEKR